MFYHRMSWWVIDVWYLGKMPGVIYLSVRKRTAAQEFRMLLNSFTAAGSSMVFFRENQRNLRQHAGLVPLAHPTIRRFGKP